MSRVTYDWCVFGWQKKKRTFQEERRTFHNDWECNLFIMPDKCKNSAICLLWRDVIKRSQ
jgi:hypothetical protein